MPIVARLLLALSLPTLALACGGSDAPGAQAGSAGASGKSGAGGAGKAGSGGASGKSGGSGGAGKAGSGGAGKAGSGGASGKFGGSGGASGSGAGGSAGSNAGTGGAGGGEGGTAGAGGSGTAGHGGKSGAGGAAGSGGCVCDEPPPSSSFAACVPGKTFAVALGGGCQTSCDAAGKCVYGTIELPCPSPGAKLPQKAPWHVALRESMKARTAAELAPSKGHVTATSADVAALSRDELYRLWVMGHKDAFWNLPHYGGALLPASQLLLSSIESQSPPLTMVGRESPLQPLFLAFYFTWNYAGNPFFHDEALLRRTFQLTSGDLVMTAHCQANGGDPLCQNANNSGLWESVASALRNYGAVALAAREAASISACDQAAFAAGTREVLAALEAHPGPSPNADWMIAGVQAAAYVELAYPSLKARARALAATLMEKSCNPAGFCAHQNGGFDASYEGWTLEHLVAGALATDDPAIDAWVERFSRLKAHLTLPDPVSGGFVGPTHFSPATSAPSAQDQGDYRTYARDVGAAMVTAEAGYFPHGGRAGYPALPTVAEMSSSVASRIAAADAFARKCYSPALDASVSCDDASITVTPWQVRHYGGGPLASALHPAPGAYDAFAAALAAGAPTTKLPVARAGDATQVFGAPGSEVFVFEKRGALVSLIHTGDVEAAADSGFGGGALSAVYADGAGPVLLGWNTGAQNAGFTWADSERWPTHAVLGRAGAARWSSAKLRSPTVTVTAGATTTIVAKGDLKTAASGSIAESIDYTRTFVVDGARVHVTTALSGTPTVRDVFEALPVWDGDGGAAATAVTLRAEGQSAFVAATTAPSSSVREVELARGAGKVRVLFDAPVTLRLGPAVTASANGWSPRSRALLVQLVDGTPVALGARSVGYAISSP